VQIVSFNDYVPGVVKGNRTVDISRAVEHIVGPAPPMQKMPALVARFKEVEESVRELVESTTGDVALADVQLRVPTGRPGKMLFGVGNYLEGLDPFNEPVDLFLKSPSSILDPGGTVVLPPNDTQLFFHEAEFGVVIGEYARNVSAAEANDYIFGYIGVIDVSARIGPVGGIQNKSFDTFCPLGPCITTADEMHDVSDVRIRLWVNDILHQDYSTSDMHHKIPELIEFGSSVMTLEPGDVIACGTNHSGLGPIQHGDTVTLEVDGVGSFSVTVSDDRRRRWPHGPDPAVGDRVRQYHLTGNMPLDSMFSVHPLP